MTIVRVEMYVAECDHPGCGQRDTTEEYIAWATPQQAHIVATLDGAFVSPPDEPGKYYCDAHTAWCEECDEQMPINRMVQDPADKSWYCKTHAPAALLRVPDEHDNTTYDQTAGYPH